jgi:hypothetical protein
LIVWTVSVYIALIIKQSKRLTKRDAHNKLEQSIKYSMII